MKGEGTNPLKFLSSPRRTPSSLNWWSPLRVWRFTICNSRGKHTGSVLRRKNEKKNKEAKQHPPLETIAIGVALTDGIGSGYCDGADGHESHQPEAEKDEKVSRSGPHGHGLRLVSLLTQEKIRLLDVVPFQLQFAAIYRLSKVRSFEPTTVLEI
jgi:hypothetical protein